MSETIEFSDEQLREEAEELSRRVLGVSAAVAWERVKTGELEGTLFAARLHQLHFLIGDDWNAPLAAE